MKASLILMSAALLVPALMGCGGDDGDGGNGGSISEACEKGCTTGGSLGCANDEPSTCIADCEQRIADAHLQFPDCIPEFDTVQVCVANLPAASWECGSNGRAQPEMDQCQAEQAAAGVCILGG